MAEDRGDFLRRWSRRKRAATAQPPAGLPPPTKPPATLPDVDSLTFESDFRAFMQAKVEEGVKRAALKKLFADPRFNVIDYMDVYIDDYTNLETIPQDMLARLEHAKSTLAGPKDEPPTRQATAARGPQDARAPQDMQVPQEPREPGDVAQAPAPEKDGNDGAAG